MTPSRLIQVLAIFATLFLSACATQASQETQKTAPETTWEVKSIEKGIASWYGVRCNGGTHTASGETLRDHSQTAAHKTLPMNTKVRVTNLSNGKSEIVRINNRGPYIRGRIIDVTEGVAKKLGFYKNGLTKVKVEVVEKIQPEEGEDAAN